MFSALFHGLSESDKDNAIENIIQHASPRQDFFLMLVLAIGMAVFGVLLQSIIVVIASMLIAPLLYPLLSLALGIIAADETLIVRSLYTIGKSVVLSLAGGFVIAFLFSPHQLNTAFLFGSGGSQASLIYAVIAAIAGFAAAFAMVKPHLNETLPGVAIAVALVPPLAVAGTALALFDWQLFSQALLLFLANVIGILFSAMIVFALFRFSTKKKVTEQAVKQEEKIVEKETKPQTA